MARIGIDLDGVCFDFSASLLRYLIDIGLELPSGAHGETNTWAFYEQWGLSLDEFIAYCNDGADAGYVFAGPVRPGTNDAFDILHAAGHELHIITDRAFGSTRFVSEERTREWLAEHGLTYESLTFSGDKTCVKTDYFVEDKLQNYDALEEAGVRVFLVDRPWNQVEGGDDRRRVDGVRHFAQIVAQELAEADVKSDQQIFIEGLLDIPDFMRPEAEVGIDYAYAQAGVKRAAEPEVSNVTNIVRIGDRDVAWERKESMDRHPAGQDKTEEIRLVSASGGAKGSKIERFDLIPAGPMQLLARLYGEGAKKYADRNWEKGYDWSLSFAALNRHLWLFWAGEDLDEETQVPHIVNVMWHAAALTQFMSEDRYAQYDNRESTVRAR